MKLLIFFCLQLTGGGTVFVHLSVNNTETFQVGDKIKAGFDGTILGLNPGQINTLFVEAIE